LAAIHNVSIRGCNSTPVWGKFGGWIGSDLGPQGSRRATPFACLHSFPVRRTV